MATTTRNRSDATSTKKKLSPQTATRTAAPPAANGNGAAPSSSEVLSQLYLALLKSRMVQEYAQRHLSGLEYDFAIGHEAVVVGSIFGLGSQDTIAASKRNFAALAAGAVPLKHLLQQRDTTHSCSYGLGSIVSPALLPADPFNMGTGLALVHKLQQQKNVVVALCSEVEPLLEHWQESLKFAGAQKMPIIYVIKSVAVDPDSAAPHNPHLEEVSFTARNYGFPGIVVDGADVVAVWRVAQESLHRARNGAGPTLIDCRMESGQDPLAHMERYLRKRNLWDDAWKKRVTGKIKRELKAATSAPVKKLR